MNSGGHHGDRYRHRLARRAFRVADDLERDGSGKLAELLRTLASELQNAMDAERDMTRLAIKNTRERLDEVKRQIIASKGVK